MAVTRNVSMPVVVALALEKRSEEEDRPASRIVSEALRIYLGLESLEEHVQQQAPTVAGSRSAACVEEKDD